ncbi:putative DNA directed RNA polymerase III subunit Rpc82 [Aspergillus mulundensis]|uniref:DNA-directed RNA polymerase III subunit RPC3 n=1 Tax=Aspergillus mulundensis TaxID=1810919 RepID=A0A3D8T3R8_9EURO|nr:DNA-directed RNA polymerase III subunit rpc3 [Aspergillus mulundensis]RDW93196.1 DNA-directed RNA polymerase III subunit rpc3 [Aspergillus mulundensis]
MASQYAAELCMLMVEDNFGELFGRIFSTLHRYERLTLPRLLGYTRLSENRLRAALVAMIQHHLVYFYTAIEEGGVTYYSANMQAAYYLVRSGKILELVEDRLGKYAATVMSTIMYLGHAQVSDLDTLPDLRPEAPNTNGAHNEEVDLPGEDIETNGTNGEYVLEQSALHPTLKALAGHGYIVRVREAHFQSNADNILNIERQIRLGDSAQSMKGKRLEEYVLEKTENMLRERLDGDLTRGHLVNGVPRGVNRNRASGGSADADNNRELFDYEDVGDGEEEDEWADDEVPMDARQSSITVRVNYEKLDVALRNRRFLELAERDAPSETAQIYDYLLRRIEYQTSRCRDTSEIPREGEEGEQYSVAIPLSALAQDIDHYLDLVGSLAPINTSTNRLGKRSLDDAINDDDDNDENGTNGNRTFEIDQHLCLLAQPPLNLTSKRLNGGIIHWTIEFRHLARKLRHLELERIVEARYGDVALRVLRVLQAKGKLDEKRLQEISLLPFKDLRQVLASMQTGGFVDLQEVPRDAQRQPSRTIYLWYYDPDRIRDSMLQDTYKSMSRCLHRLNFERGRLKDFLEKTERSDVKGNEELYLSEGELEKLREWRAKEALLLGEVSRLDDMVAVMRDY